MRRGAGSTLVIRVDARFSIPQASRQYFPLLALTRRFGSSERDGLLTAKENSIKKTNEHRKRVDMKPKYDFSSMKGGVRGKHLQEYRNGTNVVLLQPDVAEAFPTEDAVNEALRSILNTARAVRKAGGMAESGVPSTLNGSKRRRR